MAQGAPKGNKFAKGFGRPPAESLTNEMVIKIGEELLQWMDECDADPKCDVVHLSEFYSEKKGIDRIYWKEYITKRECFLPYYQRALDWMGKRTMKNKKIHSAHGARFLPVYFRELHETEQEAFERQEDYKAKKRLESETIVDEDLKQQMSTFMSMITSMQDQRSKERAAHREAMKPEEIEES